MFTVDGEAMGVLEFELVCPTGVPALSLVGADFVLVLLVSFID